MEQVAVTVVCLAYNHEQYIRKALDGFVMQETTFPFEILIHDDASTDRTAAMIREYEAKYPDLIRGIYESENQYSKQNDAFEQIIYKQVRGTYIAFCEGDDYWIDPLKLQKQYEALEKHPEIDICTTAAKTEREGQIVGQVAPSATDRIIPVQEVIRGRGDYVASPSIMYRACIRQTPLPFFSVKKYDYSLQILGSLRGGMLYLAEPTCVYRTFAKGSWSADMDRNAKAYLLHGDKEIQMLSVLDQDTGGKYQEDIQYSMRSMQFYMYNKSRCYKQLLQPEYREWFRQFSVAHKILTHIGSVCPKLADRALDIYSARN